MGMDVGLHTLALGNKGHGERVLIDGLAGSTRLGFEAMAEKTVYEE